MKKIKIKLHEDYIPWEGFNYYLFINDEPMDSIKEAFEKLGFKVEELDSDKALGLRSKWIEEKG